MTGPLLPQGWYPDPAAQGLAPEALAPKPQDDPFYTYSGSTPLESIAPGTVLATRSIPYHILGIPTALKTTQLLYRSTSQTGKPTVNVTSVVQPLGQHDKTKVISYQSAYDSLNRNDQPSHAIAGGLTFGGIVPNVELAVFGLFLTRGFSVVVPDTEGQRADFAAGPEYGMNTLDSIRAAFNSPAVGLPADARIALLGYSGGAIASEWAAELAPTYARDVNARTDRRGHRRRARPPGAQPALRRGHLLLGGCDADGLDRHRASVRDRLHAVSHRPRPQALPRHAEHVDRERPWPATLLAVEVGRRRHP